MPATETTDAPSPAPLPWELNSGLMRTMSARLRVMVGSVSLTALETLAPVPATEESITDGVATTSTVSVTAATCSLKSTSSRSPERDLDPRQGLLAEARQLRVDVIAAHADVQDVETALRVGDRLVLVPVAVCTQ